MHRYTDNLNRHRAVPIVPDASPKQSKRREQRHKRHLPALAYATDDTVTAHSSGGELGEAEGDVEDEEEEIEVGATSRSTAASVRRHPPPYRRQHSPPGGAPAAASDRIGQQRRLIPQPYAYTEVNPPSLQQLRHQRGERHNPYLGVARRCIEQFTSAEDDSGTGGVARRGGVANDAVDHLEYSRDSRRRDRDEMSMRSASVGGGRRGRATPGHHRGKEPRSRGRQLPRTNGRTASGRSEHRPVSRAERRPVSRSASGRRPSLSETYSDDDRSYYSDEYSMEEEEDTTLSVENHHRTAAVVRRGNERDPSSRTYYSTHPYHHLHQQQQYIPTERTYEQAYPAQMAAPVYSAEMPRISARRCSTPHAQQQQPQRQQTLYTDHKYSSPPDPRLPSTTRHGGEDTGARGGYGIEEGQTYAVDRRCERLNVDPHRSMEPPRCCAIHGAAPPTTTTASCNTDPCHRDPHHPASDSMRKRAVKHNEGHLIGTDPAEHSREYENHASLYSLRDCTNMGVAGGGDVGYRCSHCGVSVSLLRPCPTCGRFDQSKAGIIATPVSTSIPEIYLKRSSKKRLLLICTLYIYICIMQYLIINYFYNRQKLVKKEEISSEESISEFDVSVHTCLLCFNIIEI